MTKTRESADMREGLPNLKATSRCTLIVTRRIKDCFRDLLSWFSLSSVSYYSLSLTTMSRSIIIMHISFIIYNNLIFNDFFSSIDLAGHGLIINQSMRLIIILCMIIAVAFAYFQMVKLDVNEAAHNSLDNFLCLMCLPAFFVQGIFSIIAGSIIGNALAVTGTICEVSNFLNTNNYY